jgi:FKBP-type peptidyl-prolyl cis-trans isomerase
MFEVRSKERIVMRRASLILLVSLLLVAGFALEACGNSGIFGDTNNSGQQQQSTAPEVGIVDLVVGTGDAAQTGDTVTVYYEGRFEDGSVFESSFESKTPFSFTLGTGRVIAGWDVGIVNMKVGGVRELTIPPELAYGSEDYSTIPGGSTLIFRVELLSID